MTQLYEHAWHFVSALGGGDPDTVVIDWRAIHDTDKGVRAETTRGTLAQCWSWLCQWNNSGYGIFAVIAQLDGIGQKLPNVMWLRANYIDLDDFDAQQQLERASAAWPAPAFTVNSSPGKYHVYWPVQFYSGNDRFELIQRKLRQTFNGDKKVIDAARVMRVPGTYHLKATPYLVQISALPGWGSRCTVDQLEQALVTVNVIDGGEGQRHDLGDPSLAAPSLEWLRYALELVDPNDLDRTEWIALTAAIKQAGWTLAEEATLFAMWSQWCSRYVHGEGNDERENLKQWNSIRNTELGWQSMTRRIPSLQAAATFGGVDRSAQVPQPAAAHLSGTPAPVAPTPPTPAPPALDCSGEFLTHIEQQQWFKDCTFVVNLGEMLVTDGRFLNSSQFNAAYGGKQFIIDSVGKKTNEAWAAATRSTLWTVPKVDHVRFVPDAEYRCILVDDLGRSGINVYRPANVRRVQGDPSPFLNHVAALLPNPVDQQILLSFLAHNIRFPGRKIPWAPVIQSTEGAGKGVLKLVLKHAMGKPYVYFPKASELAKSGATFNKWLRHKLFILVDEIKVDERRELIEVLKPLISENETEVQAKGVDQDLEDNFSNWLFFTNWKDAIPVNKNGRRFAIMYSPLQTVDDLIARNMNQAYFDALYGWLEADGAAIVTDYLMNYPIERGGIPMRAPETSSTAEAIANSRGPVERMIMEAIEDQLPGFRGGWISSIAVTNRIRDTGVARIPGSATLHGIIEGLGYVACGRADRCYFQEDAKSRAHLFHWNMRADVAGYGSLQGW